MILESESIKVRENKRYYLNNKGTMKISHKYQKIGHGLSYKLLRSTFSFKGFTLSNQIKLKTT